MLNGIRRKIYFIKHTVINNQDKRDTSPESVRLIENAERYSKMKKINRKYSNIVLTKRSTQRTRLEMKKASHSLDLGVKSTNSIYKPNFSKTKTLASDSTKYATLFYLSVEFLIACRGIYQI